MKTDALPTGLRLAAIITLLSSSALHGVTAGKAAALLGHLEAAALSGEVLDRHLRNALEDALALWLSIECHHRSVTVEFCALAFADQALH